MKADWSATTSSMETAKLANIVTCRPRYISLPAVATVGLTEADTAGKDYEAKTNDLSGWMSGRTYAETVAWSKVLVENGTGKILGAHLAAHGAKEVIHIFAFATRYGVPASHLSSTVYAYPTFMSDVKNLV